MFSNLLIQLVAHRISAMKIVGAAAFSWDYKSQRAIKSNTYLHWNWYLGIVGGIIYSCVMTSHLVSKITADDDEDEDTMQTKNKMRQVATDIIGWSEVTLAIAICLISFTVIQHSGDVIYLLNQLLIYNEERMRMLKSGGQSLGQRHKEMLQKNDLILITVVILSVTVPMPLGVIFAHPAEPTGRMMREWLELDVALTLEYLPVFIICGIFLIAASNGAIVLCIVTGMYFSVAKLGLDDLQPMTVESVKNLGNGCYRYEFQTRGYGILSDDQIIAKYRMQQRFNFLLNNILESVLVSFHQVAILGVVISLSYFTVKFHYILLESGTVGCLAVFGVLFAAFFLEICQAVMFGLIVDASHQFKESGRKLAGRRSLYRKFLKSCATFYVRVTYPFYTVHRRTFLMFCETAFGQTVNLLLA